MKTLATLGNDFNKRHGWLLYTAKRLGVALCGGCAAAVTKGNAEYVPKDIDFVAKQSDALLFIAAINEFMLKRSVHYRVYANSKNKFVPKTATAHFRITSPLWLPVCLFLIPDDKFRSYRIARGHILQLYTDIQSAAADMTEIDSKPRMASEPEEAPDPMLTQIIEDIMHATPERVGSGSKSP
jgi:hypothetical protein